MNTIIVQRSTQALFCPTSQIGIIALILLLFIAARTKPKTVVEEKTVVVEPVDPIQPCLPPLDPLFVWPFPGTNAVRITSTAQVDVQTAITAATNGTIVYLDMFQLILTSPLVINSSITLLGLPAGTRILTTTPNIPLVTVNAPNVVIQNLNFLNVDTGSSACGVLVQGSSDEIIFTQCKFNVSVQAVRVTVQAGINANNCYFTPSVDTTPLDYIVFTSGSGTSSFSNCVWTPKMTGSTPISRLIVRRAGTYNNFSIQVLDNTTNNNPNAVLLAVYAVLEETATSVSTESTQQVSMWNNDFGYVSGGVMRFEGAELTMGKYKWLTLFNSIAGFQQPIGNATLLLEGYIVFTKPSAGGDPGVWGQTKPTIYSGQSILQTTQLDPNFALINGSGPSAFMRDTTRLQAANPPFQILAFGGCNQ